MFHAAIPVIKVRSSVAALEFYGRGLGFALVSSWRPDETNDRELCPLAHATAVAHLVSSVTATPPRSRFYLRGKSLSCRRQLLHLTRQPLIRTPAAAAARPSVASDNRAATSARREVTFVHWERN
jgi:hypothetical protein